MGSLVSLQKHFLFQCFVFFVLIIRSLCSVIIYTDEDTLKNANVKCLFVFVYTLQVSGFQSFLNTIYLMYVH